MTRSDIIRLIGENRDRLTELKVKRLALFGSVARGEDRPDSDVDVLVEFDGLATFDGYFTLKELLERLIGKPVDLVTDAGLKPRVRPIIQKEAVFVA